MDDATGGTGGTGAARATTPGSHRRPPAGVRPEGERLTGRELRLLQLLARGYSPDQLAALHGGAPLETLWDLQRVLTILGAPTVRDAVAEVRRRGLLD